MIYHFRYETLEKRGLAVHHIRECGWNNMRQQYPTIDEFCKNSKSGSSDCGQRVKSFNENTAFGGNVKGLGLLVFNIKVPQDDNGRLRHYVQGFAPI